MTTPRYPVYVPTRHRSATPLTIRFLERDHVPHQIVVRPDDADAYRAVRGRYGDLLVLPDAITNLRETRNWIREHAESYGHARHWQLDDNMRVVRRLYRGRRIPCNSGPALAAVEDFADRYSNVGLAGLNYQMFGFPGSPPYLINVHVYSTTLVNHAMPCRWNLDYNEDTDICLQAITTGWATVNVNVFLADKMTTMTMKGGNTDRIYQGDGRLRMARALERAWPGLVKIQQRYGRVTHQVDWARFRDNPRLELRPDVDLDALPRIDEYGLRLREVKPVRHARLRRMMTSYESDTGYPTIPHAGGIPR